jgi:hypothetical protein
MSAESDPLQHLVTEGRMSQVDLDIHRLFVPDKTIDLDHPVCRHCGKAVNLSPQQVRDGLDDAWEMDTSVKGFECAACSEHHRTLKLRKLWEDF